MDSKELYCATCAAVVPFEQRCQDGHDDCPEWACIRCGEAILLAPLTLVAVNAWPHRAVPRQRRAA
jgi:hypothetical protein